jgi:hypothetical protein
MTYEAAAASLHNLGISHVMQQSSSRPMRDLAGKWLKDHTGNRIMETAWYSAQGHASPLRSHIYLSPKSASKRRVTETCYKRLQRKSHVRAYLATR